MIAFDEAAPTSPIMLLVRHDHCGDALSRPASGPGRASPIMPGANRLALL
jgi:hypothetical protein